MSVARAKGTRWESAIVGYLNENGFPHVERRALAGAADKGDIGGLPGWVIEAKNCGRDALPAWIDEVTAEQANAGAEFGAVWHHRRGKGSPGDGFVTITGATAVRILHALRRGT